MFMAGFALFFFWVSLIGQDLAGAWHGKLKGGSLEVPVTVTIVKDGNGEWTATMTSWDDPRSSVEVTAVILDRLHLTLAIYRVGATFDGKISPDGNTVAGTFRRRGREMPLILRRESK
jgi:hypothetical protein